ncbi:ABC transporter ATP-binding protein [Candidatus Dependentiae bacterium]|nr:ABC transporter ATP-binding protein [Candidatus Dependentiae bacterium]
MNNPVLEVNNLSKNFSPQSRPAVDNLSFSLHRGEILGLLGPNGAGKTTTIQMLLGTLRPSNGRIAYFGLDFFKQRSEALEKIGFASTYANMPEHLSVTENLRVHGFLQGLSHTELAKRIDYLLDLFRLSEKRFNRFSSLSAGQRTRVLLAKAFLHNPEIVLLDEPTAALDPDIAEQIRSYILHEQKKRNLTVFFTSHNMHEITYLCDRVLVLKDGSLLADDTPHNLAAAVSKAHINLIAQNGFEALKAYAQLKNLSFIIKENVFSFSIEEKDIAALLSDMAAHHIAYTHISIDKPTLEDYFLQVAGVQSIKDKDNE